jgi:hypothetical protein
MLCWRGIATRMGRRRPFIGEQRRTYEDGEQKSNRPPQCFLMHVPWFHLDLLIRTMAAAAPGWAAGTPQKREVLPVPTLVGL